MLQEVTLLELVRVGAFVFAAGIAVLGFDLFRKSAGRRDAPKGNLAVVYGYLGVGAVLYLVGLVLEIVAVVG